MLGARPGSMNVAGVVASLMLSRSRSAVMGTVQCLKTSPLGDPTSELSNVCDCADCADCVCGDSPSDSSSAVSCLSRPLVLVSALYGFKYVSSV